MTEKISSKSDIISDLVGDSFLLAARRLREVQDERPDEFAMVAQNLGIGVRTSFYLANIDRKFRDLGIDDSVLTAIGWTKLRLLANHVSKGNCHQLL